MATTKKTAPQITPPFGYGAVAPLQKTDKVLLPAPGTTPEFCRSTNALALSFSEFNAAARDYPVVFTCADAGKTYAPLIVLGLAEAQNLFVDSAGAWDATAYVPAFVRRYPFCISTFELTEEKRVEKVVCIASTHVDRRGAPLFDATGTPTPQWRAAERLLQDYQRDLEVTARMCATFAGLGLFSPFTFEVRHAEAEELKLQGMHRIDEHKLKALEPAKLASLVAQGLMGKIYAHMHSLENFARLYQRALARAEAVPKRKRAKRAKKAQRRA